MKIIFSGGGTLGPVTPLLALIETLNVHEPGAHEFLWIATERGVEIPLLKKAGVTVVAIPSGKLRRYFSMKNFSDLLQMVRGFRAAREIIRDFSPDVCVTAGGYVSVPVHLAAWMSGVPTLVHQQDVHIGLANKIMSWWAARVTVSLSQHVAQFKKGHAIFTGNPVRPSIVTGTHETAVQMFKLDPSRATVFIFGGGTGAEIINAAVETMVPEACELFQIIHVTGMNRARPRAAHPHYHTFPFLTAEMAAAYAAADVVVARAGFNTITEIAACGKPAILIPIHGSHQELNAAWVVAAGAAVIVREADLTGETLLGAVRDLLADQETYESMALAARGLFPADAAGKILQEIANLSQKLSR